MLWSKNKAYELEPFDYEAELEYAIIESSEALFGNLRIFLDMKKLIAANIFYIFQDQ